MKGAPPPTHRTDVPDSSVSIGPIIAALLEEETASGPISDAAIRRRFPDDYESILQALRDARAIAAAAESARQFGGDSADSFAKPSSEEDFSLLQQSLPGFEILEWIGSGGQGAVYRAVQKSTHRTVALKILLNSRLSSSNHAHRFSREVEIAAQLQHPNIVRVFDSGMVLGRPYFVMEFVDGMSIDDFVATRRPSIEDRLRLFIEVCKAVSHAHQRGVIHRDLKSANVIVDFDGKPHVLDFGLAKCFDDTLGVRENWNVSLPGQIVGTLPYLSPEQALGLPDAVDTRSDVYSLGVILFQILTGAMPYPLDGTPDTLRRRIAHEDPMSFRSALARAELPPYDSEAFLPDDLEQIVHQALAKDKDRRYQSADALADDLDRFLSGQAVHAKAESTMYVLRKTVRRYRVQVAVAGAFVLMLVVALIGMTILWKRADRLATAYQGGLQMGSYLRLASVDRDEGRLQNAVELFRKAIEISEMVPVQDDGIHKLTFDVHQRLAELSLEMNDVSSAWKLAGSAMDLARQGVEANPRDPEWKRSLGIAYRLKGRLEFTADHRQAALADYQESKEIRESLVRENPSNTNLKVDLASTYRLLGVCYRKLNQREESGRYYQAAVDIHRQLFEQEPDSLSRNVDFSIAEVGIAAWYMSDPARRHDHDARRILENIEARLSKYEDQESGAPRAWDIYRTLKGVRQNLGILSRRSTTTSSQPAGSASSPEELPRSRDQHL